MDYDEDCTFDVTILKGKIETHVTFLGSVDTWQTFAKHLLRYPATVNDKAAFEVRGGPCQDYFCLNAYCYDAAGHTAVQVITDNNEDIPGRCRMEFSIRAEAASINNLGRLLLDWQVENDSEIIWQAQTS
ncbi:hypothetical protein E5K00_18625 [Hymenobacter aquaticus]|uniref:Uncharacterized protein n=1 Tax=Hymenobacter aquaticus TaxID=1867101 RepID=A0A4Z0PZD6_9BACT|nr:hypothetical protein E5K00_18625 [Hymenobacter aquaticus]